MGPDNKGHVRYPLYNAYNNDTLKKTRKERKPHGNVPPTPPQSKMHEKKMRRNKNQLPRNCVLHSTKTSPLCKFVLIEDFVEYVDICMDLMK
jgi:hypothetical protein